VTNRVKRCVDVALGSAGLVVLSPLLLLVALVVRVSLGRPILFRQERTGLHGHPFMLVKFRTMIDLVDDRGNPLPDADRLTRVGHWLRASSLDELPELWSVIRGDMSLVGPRPLPVRYMNRYSAYEARRHEVRPGLTGWAQVNGRNMTTWEDRLAFDVWYVDNMTLVLDLKILARTAVSVFRRDAVSPTTGVTMAEFRPEADDR
jgi:lipopolysaccharide/colanic/teichoic acid biosynthesis glycosyltransferase